MKILFLDIDGVLNFRMFFKNSPFPGFLDFERVDPSLIAILNKVIEQTQAKVVISSSWRLDHSIEELQSFLSNFGFIGEIIDRTPAFTFKGKRRGDEINFWLNNNEPVESFVIIDDSSDMTNLMDHLVQTSFETGITEENAQEAIRILNG